MFTIVSAQVEVQVSNMQVRNALLACEKKKLCQYNRETFTDVIAQFVKDQNFK